MKDLRVEVYRTIYEEPIYPKNLWMDQPPQARPVRDQHLQKTFVACRSVAFTHLQPMARGEMILG